MTFQEFDQVMTDLELNYSIGVIFNLDLATDCHKRWQLLEGKNDQAAEKARQDELGYQRLALSTAIDESIPNAVTVESTIPKMTREELIRVNQIIKRWNKYLAHFDKRVPEIGE